MAQHPQRSGASTLRCIYREAGAKEGYRVRLYERFYCGDTAAVAKRLADGRYQCLHCLKVVRLVQTDDERGSTSVELSDADRRKLRSITF